MFLKRFLVFASLVGVVASSSIARAQAPDKQACLASYEGGQRARQRSALVEAHERFLTCAQDACPEALRGDCVAWLKEVDDAMPSIVVGALDEAGHDATTTIRVTIDDGRVRLDHLDVKPIPLDPGSHKLVFQSSSGKTITQTVVLREGEKSRLVSASFFEAPTPPKSEAPPPVFEAKRKIPWFTYPIAGVAALGYAGFITFGALGYSGEKNDLERCSPRCSPDETSSVRDKYLIADVSLGIGLVATAVTLYLLLAKPGDR